MMLNTRAAAMLAIASLSGLATAQSAAAGDPACAYMHCIGPEPGDMANCCAGTRCVQKNEFYAQCIPNDKPIPSLWDQATVVLERSPAGTTADVVPATPDVVDDGEEDDDTLTPGTATDDDGELTPEEDDSEYDSEAPLVVPEIPEDVLDVRYMAFVGRDYHPLQATAGSVAVVDLPNSAYNVNAPQDCEHLCTVTPGCNAASYYLNAGDLDGNNCWLKSLEDACELPAEATFDDNAVYLIQVDESCPEFALAPMSELDAEAPLADAPFSATPGEEVIVPVLPIGAPAIPTPRSSSTTPTAPVTTPPAGSGAGGLGGALVALAVVGAAALF